MPTPLSSQVLVKQCLEPDTYTSGVAMSFADIDIRGWSKGLLIFSAGTTNDSATTVTLTLKSDAVSPASDAISSDTFTWAIAVADSDDDEVYLCDMDFRHLTVEDKRYLSFAAVALDAADTIEASMSIVLYEPNGHLPATQTNTVKWEIN